MCPYSWSRFDCGYYLYDGYYVKNGKKCSFFRSIIIAIIWTTAAVYVYSYSVLVLVRFSCFRIEFSTTHSMTSTCSKVLYRSCSCTAVWTLFFRTWWSIINTVDTLLLQGYILYIDLYPRFLLIVVVVGNRKKRSTIHLNPADC